MHSKLLKQHGLLNLIGGSEFNFRTVTQETTTLKKDYEKLVTEALIDQPIEIYTGQQTHSTNVRYADGTSGEEFIIGRQFSDTDGLITDQKNVALIVKFADCTPIVLFDPVEKVQAIVHSGWRGTVGEISKAALRKMTEDFAVKKENILVYVGPSIAQENYEVGPEVYDAFAEHKNRDVFFQPHGEKYLLDMQLANLHVLLSAGILEENIELETASTFGDPRLHSAREEGKAYGLNAMVTCMMP